MPKVSVIITAHNYERYLPQAVESVLHQTFDDWECLVVDDGSTDNTSAVTARYAGRDHRLRFLRLEGVGLARAANVGIEAAAGEYIIRLDADDYFDENILMILSNVLDRHPEYGMVYPDYYQITKHGELIDLVRQPKVNDEVKLLDRSALAAGALYRRHCFDAIGGYNEALTHQEDYDFWIRFIDRFRVYNVQLPLMYYRRHGNSMSNASGRRDAARRLVKKEFAEAERDIERKRILCVLPLVAANRYRRGLPMVRLGGRPLFVHALEQAGKVGLVDRVIVDTEDEAIAEAARNHGADVPFLRPRRLAKLSVQTTDILRHLLERLWEEEGYAPDIVMSISYNYPFVTAAHMEEALHTLAIHDCDSVIGVGINTRFHWQPGEFGLQPVLYPRQLVADQKWVTYEERGGLFVLKADNLKGKSFLGHSTSFVEIAEEEGFRIDSDFHLWLAEQMLETGYYRQHIAEPAAAMSHDVNLRAAEVRRYPRHLNKRILGE